MDFSLLFLFQMNFGDDVFAKAQTSNRQSLFSKLLLNELLEICFVTHGCIDPEKKRRKKILILIISKTDGISNLLVNIGRKRSQLDMFGIGNQTCSTFTPFGRSLEISEISNKNKNKNYSKIAILRKSQTTNVSNWLKVCFSLTA